MTIITAGIATGMDAITRMSTKRSTSRKWDPCGTHGDAHKIITFHYQLNLIDKKHAT